jgi:hypothetical protein
LNAARQHGALKGQQIDKTFTDRWLVDNPLWVTFVIAPLFSAFLLYVVLALWSFVKVKPQQLNLWILRSQLLKAESKLQDFHRLREDQRYLIFSCFEYLFYLGLSITLVLATILAEIEKQ